MWWDRKEFDPDDFVMPGAFNWTPDNSRNYYGNSASDKKSKPAAKGNHKDPTPESPTMSGALNAAPSATDESKDQGKSQSNSKGGNANQNQQNQQKGKKGNGSNNNRQSEKGAGGKNEEGGNDNASKKDKHANNQNNGSHSRDDNSSDSKAQEIQKSDSNDQNNQNSNSKGQNNQNNNSKAQNNQSNNSKGKGNKDNKSKGQDVEQSESKITSVVKAPDQAPSEENGKTPVSNCCSHCGRCSHGGGVAKTEPTQQNATEKVSKNRHDNCMSCEEVKRLKHEQQVLYRTLNEILDGHDYVPRRPGFDTGRLDPESGRYYGATPSFSSRRGGREFGMSDWSGMAYGCGDYGCGRPGCSGCLTVTSVREQYTPYHRSGRGYRKYG